MATLKQQGISSKTLWSWYRMLLFCPYSFKSGSQLSVESNSRFAVVLLFALSDW